MDPVVELVVQDPFVELVVQHPTREHEGGQRQISTCIPLAHKPGPDAPGHKPAADRVLCFHRPRARWTPLWSW